MVNCKLCGNKVDKKLSYKYLTLNNPKEIIILCSSKCLLIYKTERGLKNNGI